MAHGSAERQEFQRDIGLLIVRLGFGLGFFWYHGLPKLRGGPSSWENTGSVMANFGMGFGAEWWGLAAAVSECIGGLLIAAGFLFRPAAVAIALVMSVAATVHVVTGEGSPAHSGKNAFLFYGLLFIGPGRYSVDALLRRRRVGSGEPAASCDPVHASAAGD